MNLQPATLFQFDFFQPLPIHIQVSDAPLTSDAEPRPRRQFDQRIGLTHQFAAALDDPRHPDLVALALAQALSTQDCRPRLPGCFVFQLPSPQLAAEQTLARSSPPHSARTAPPPIYCGHIDMRTQAEETSARRSGTPA